MVEVIFCCFDSQENIYFMLFTGESFDYIGSSRIVYDMKRQQFPFSIEDGKPV